MDRHARDAVEGLEGRRRRREWPPWCGSAIREGLVGRGPVAGTAQCVVVVIFILSTTLGNRLEKNATALGQD